MNSMRIMRWSNGLLFLCALLQVATGLPLFFGIDDIGPIPAFGIHKYNGLVFIALVCVHFSLNWPWFRSQFFRRRPVNRLSRRRPD